MSFDASQARFIRKRHAEQGLDQQEQEEQREFGQNLQKALDVYGNKNKKKNIESQVEYFGNMIEPFNMRQEQDMGDIDQQGYFVFKRRNEYKDAWLQSIEEQNDMMVADKVKKRIKTQGVGWKGVYDDDKNRQEQMQQVNQDQNENDEDEQNDEQKQEENENEQQKQQPNQISLQPHEIKQLICQLLPMNKSANAYIKDLKKKIKDPQSKQLHDKILELCNMYIQKTNEYDILTLKKEQLQIQVGEKEEDSGEINWDQEQGSQQEKQKQQQVRENKNTQNFNKSPAVNNQNSNKMQTPQNNQQEEYENDDIF